MGLVEEHKDFKNLMDSLRCPLCDFQLDGNIYPKKAMLYCCRSNSEYKCIWMQNEIKPESETINHYYPQYRYQIQCSRISLDKYVNSIYRINMDLAHLYQEREKKLILDFTGDRMVAFHKRMEEKDFLSKLKLYLVFS